MSFAAFVFALFASFGHFNPMHASGTVTLHASGTVTLLNRARSVDHASGTVTLIHTGAAVDHASGTVTL